MQMMIATVRRAPRSMPGKKPASTAAAVNLFSFLVEVAAAAEDVSDAALADLLAEELGLLVDEADVDAGFELAAALLVVVEAGLAEEEAAACITHWPLEQVKPFGQQVLMPHVWSVPVKSVLWSSLSGCREAFCWLRSHVRGDIVLQSRPLGQQTTDLLLLKAVHVVPDGQQKLDGMPGLLQGE